MLSDRKLNLVHNVRTTISTSTTGKHDDLVPSSATRIKVEASLALKKIKLDLLCLL